MKIARFVCWTVLVSMMSTTLVVAQGDAPAAQDTASEATEAEVPVSKTIQIADEPRAIGPLSVMPERFAKKVSVEMDDWTLDEFQAWLQETLQVAVLLDVQALEDAGVSKFEQVNQTVVDQPIYFAIRRVLDSCVEPLDFYYEDDVLTISTQLEIEEMFVSQTYDVSPLLEAGYEADALINALQSCTTGPWLDIDGIGGSVQQLGDILFIRATQRGHTEIRCVFEVLKRPARRTFVLVPKEDLELLDQLDRRIDVDFRGQPFERALQMLTEQTKLPITIDEITLEDAGISPREPVKLVMNNLQLGVVLRALVTTEPLTTIARNGQLVLTTRLDSEEIMQTAVYDVRDLARDADESAALTQAVQSQTTGPWMDIDGVGGSIEFPRPGTMVVYGTMQMHDELLNLLTIYRESLSQAKIKPVEPPDPNRILTRYYLMQAEMANGLVPVLPALVGLDEWNEGKQGDEPVPPIVQVPTEPKMISFKGATNQVSQPRAVLVIEQTFTNHQRIEKVLQRLRSGDGSVDMIGQSQGGGVGGGMGGYGGGGFGGGGGQSGGKSIGFGGGFFRVPAE